MRPQLNGRLVRLFSLIFIILCLGFLFKYLHNLELKNELIKKQEAERQQSLQQREKENQRLLEIEKENKRQQHILNNRAVVEPEITLENTKDLLQKYFIGVPTPVAPWKDETLPWVRSPLGQQLLSDLLTIPENMPNFKTLTTQQRVFKSLFEYLDPIIAEGSIDVTRDPHYRDVWAIYSRLETILYPWLKPYWKSAFEINLNTRSKRGIVMCVGNGQFKYASTAVQSIRELHKSTIPIEIFYINPSDLSKSRRDFFESFENVKTVDISDRINNDHTQFGGWAIKPYAMLASSFQEVILMDADVYMFKRPETLFEDQGYQRTGALFFLDRTLFDNYEEGRQWLRSFLPTYSTYVEQSRWWKTTSAHEQESGIVVMDKRKVLMGLLATCKMNDKEERDKVSYKHIHGDKETFWIGYEMSQTPYVFVRSLGAVLGGLGDEGAEGTVCGNQLHLDAVDNRPWWWNGGLLRDKNRWDDRYLTFSHFAEGSDWQFETSCINEKDKIRKLNEKEREIGNTLIEMDKEKKNRENLV
ncbi:mannosyltransferase putative-domain-containing protein [Sporodiniella umbellata]|nr:mannosyltransferase putative-domain-containing protein [Sporodiniella umbellata]